MKTIIVLGVIALALIPGALFGNKEVAFANGYFFTIVWVLLIIEIFKTERRTK